MLHGTDPDDQYCISLQRVLDEVESYYGQRDSLPPEDQALLYSSFEEHRTRERTLQQNQQWLNTWKSALERSLSSARELFASVASSVLGSDD
jgi:hypothetical protein